MNYKLNYIKLTITAYEIPTRNRGLSHQFGEDLATDIIDKTPVCHEPIRK